MGFLPWLASGKWAAAPSRPVQRRTRLSVELLEDRCLLSVAPGPGTIPVPIEVPAWLIPAYTLDILPKGNPQVVFLGDSITDQYQLSPSWAAQIAPLRAADLAVIGSRTQNVLWQLDTGLLQGTMPKVIVLMIGTNNLATGQTPQQTADGVAAILDNLRSTQPQARILLLGILPRGESPADPFRLQIAQANRLIVGLADGTTVRFLDVGSRFLQPDGSISPTTLGDFLHPTALGDAILTAAIQPPLTAMLLGARSASFAVGPFGEVAEVVSQDGTLTQIDATGAHALFGGVVAAQVSFGATGETLDVVFASGHALQLDAFGVHQLA